MIVRVQRSIVRVRSSDVVPLSLILRVRNRNGEDQRGDRQENTTVDAIILVAGVVKVLPSLHNLPSMGEIVSC